MSAVLAVCVALLLFAQNNGKSGKQPVLSPAAGLTNSPDAEPTGPVYTFVMTNTANGTIVTQTDTLPYAWHTFSLNEMALRKGQETVVVEVAVEDPVGAFRGAVGAMDFDGVPAGAAGHFHRSPAVGVGAGEGKVNFGRGFRFGFGNKDRFGLDHRFRFNHRFGSGRFPLLPTLS